MTDDPLLTSLLRAVSTAPQDVPLRLHVAELLLAAQRPGEALTHVSQALATDPGNEPAVALLQRISTAMTQQPTASEHTEPVSTRSEFDWARAEDDVRDISASEPAPEAAPATDTPGPITEEVDGAERPAVRLADVGGMENVKERLELSFLGPLRNPHLASAFGATGGGGLLLYGPPGCGKTFIARAIAGEIGARFSEFGVADVLDMWTGSSERNIAAIFAAARRAAPCVLFFDEVDALGHKRAHLTTASSMRNTVNQLLSEMDSMSGQNDGVFVLGATNHPWDIDTALRRPGRFDRMLLVLPPDAPAREAILRYHLSKRPANEVDLGKIVRATEYYSGADLAHICATAAERALAESMQRQRLVPLTTRELMTAVKEVTPSTRPWFATARNVAMFGNTDGSYDELAAYLRKHRSL